MTHTKIMDMCLENSLCQCIISQEINIAKSDT